VLALRSRDPGVSDQGQEGFFELALGRRTTDVVLVEHGAKAARARPRGVSCDLALHRVQVEHA
jgi:hypothetical protein